jgi:3-phenylpropionate/trans-cinnamate dioxygenase ferredoxin reductase subunit
VLVAIDRVVVAGAGLAGLRTAEELRARGYPGAITLVGAETRPPYDRPPLSKKVMLGELDDTSLHADFAGLRVDFRPGESATGVEFGEAPGGSASVAGGEPGRAAGAGQDGEADGGPGRVAGGDAGRGGVLRTGRGEYRFDRLVLATGATPVTLPGRGAQRVLRTFDDALELRGTLRPGLRLVIAGAGWIGAELATAAAAHGCQVTVLDVAATPLQAAVGAEVGGKTAAWYAAAGVRLLLGQGVESVEPGGLALAGGGWLDADEVVTAVGVRPATGWLDGSGIALEAGVAADEGLRASVPGVYAVGDCASFVSRRYGRRLRFEHWDVALHAPEVAAANLLGGAEIYDPVPYFWSEQFGRMLQYAGHHGVGRMLWRGDPAGADWAVCWLDGDRLAAVLTVNRPRDLVQGRRVIAAGTPVDPARLADPAVQIRNAAA